MEQQICLEIVDYLPQYSSLTVAKCRWYLIGTPGLFPVSCQWKQNCKYGNIYKHHVVDCVTIWGVGKPG